MKDVELDGREWSLLKRRLIAGDADRALRGYEPPVRLTHGNEYITYEKGGEEDVGRFN